MSSVPVIKFMFRDEWIALNEAIQIKPAYEADSFNTATDLTNYLRKASAGMIVASLREKNDVIQLITFVKGIKKAAPKTLVKVMVINFSGDKKFDKAVSKLGLLDLVESKIQTKALRFKIDFMMRSINVHVKKFNTGSSSSNSSSSKDDLQGRFRKSSDSSLVHSAPLDTVDDIWLLRSEQDSKRVLSRWLVKLMGPSPYVAYWGETDKKDVWKFEFTSQKDLFIHGGGEWFYRGDQKPDFIWSENLWSFTGSSFDLYYRSGNHQTSRMSLTKNLLTINQNSFYAKAKEQLIIQSFDKDMLFKNELLEVLEEDDIESNLSRLKNLGGKSKVDFLKLEPISGEGKTSKFSLKPLNLKLGPANNGLELSHSANQDIKRDLELSLKRSDTPEMKAKDISESGNETQNPSSNEEKKSNVEYPDFKEKKRPNTDFSAVLNKAPDKAPFKGDMTEELLPKVRKNGALAGLTIAPNPKAKENRHLEDILQLSKKNSATEEEELDDAIQTAEVIATLIQDEQKLICKLDDFFEQSIVFTAKQAQFNVGSEVLLHLSFVYMKKDTNLKFPAKISEILEDETGLFYISVEISKTNVSSFEAFMKLYGVRQEKIDLYFKILKGY